MVNVFLRKNNLNYKILKKFKSKKNNNFLTMIDNQLYVLKIYSPDFQSNAETEFKVLTKAYNAGVLVPKPIEYWPNKAILTQYIKGDNLCDVFNKNISPAYGIALAHWYASYHKITKNSKSMVLLKGDSILKNFIVTDEDIYVNRGSINGIDFEEAHYGDPALDIGQICASILNTDPMFTVSKVVICNDLIKTYSFLTGYKDLKRIKLCLVEALRFYSQWRNIKQQKNILAQADLIELKGLEALLLFI